MCWLNDGVRYTQNKTCIHNFYIIMLCDYLNCRSSMHTWTSCSAHEQPITGVYQFFLKIIQLSLKCTTGRTSGISYEQLLHIKVVEYTKYAWHYELFQKGKLTLLC